MPPASVRRARETTPSGWTQVQAQVQVPAVHPVEGEYGPAIRLGTRVDELLIETFCGFGPALEELLVEAAATRANKLKPSRSMTRPRGRRALGNFSPSWVRVSLSRS